MMGKANKADDFLKLSDDDKDLTMFTMTNLNLTEEENANMVYMSLKLKRKVTTELLTTFLPTILLLLITYTTTFFEKGMFGDALAVNLTIMLVMTTIFTSKIEELPPTSDTKMIDIWLIFCLLVPFSEVVLSTAIEFLDCGEQLKEEEEGEKKDDEIEVDARKAIKVHVSMGGRTSQVGCFSLLRKNIDVLHALFVICYSNYRALVSEYCC